MTEWSGVRAVLVPILVLLTSCGPRDGRSSSEAEKSNAGSPPATLSRPLREEDLATITLTPEAEARLGIKTELSKRANVEHSATFAGEVVVTDGRAVSVVAPFAGTLEAVAGTEPARAGATVVRGQRLFLLVPLLSPDRSVVTAPESVSMGQARSSLAISKVEASGEVERAAIEVKAAKVALSRAQKLVADDAGSARAVDEAAAALERAEATLRAAQKKEAALASTVLGSESGLPGKIPIEAPQDGIVRDVRVTPGQVVAAGSVLCGIVSLDVVWVRVPVPVGEVARLAAERDARIGPLGRRTDAPVRVAKSAKAPPTANPAANTVDLYYQLENAEPALRPGERVGVTIPMQGLAEALVVPASATLYDIHGGSWVYVNTEPHVFVSKRVVVRETTSGLALIDRGLEPGVSVVVTGAAELFGTQFGYGK